MIENLSNNPPTTGSSAKRATSYRNPILFADYSDPDAIRVGDDYWMTASSFCHSPGLPILHSKDLVHWEIVNYALPRLVPDDHYREHRAGCGVWAPAIRFHAGLYWIFYPDPDFGIYVTHTKDPRGEWSKPYLIKAGKGLIDPCPLWDEDKAYLVHGWAKSRSGICNILTLHEMSPDATSLLDEGKTVIDGDNDTEWNTIEGPKLYKHAGWYWIFAPADGVATGCQTVFRSKSIEGPYEGRKVLEQGSSPINGPHQGAWIDTADGEHWFVHFQENQPFGRVVHLQPMIWNSEDWPVMGNDPENTGVGSPVLQYPVPISVIPDFEYNIPQSDTFSTDALSPQWQWQANADPSWYQLDPSSKTLRLNCIPRTNPDSLWKAGALLMQKATGPKLQASVDVELNASYDGDSAGLIVFGYDYFFVTITQREEKNYLVMKQCLKANKGGSETIQEEIQIDSCKASLFWKMETEERSCFKYQLADETPLQIGPHFSPRESKWVGARFGVFAYSDKESQTSGYANFKNFIVT